MIVGLDGLTLFHIAISLVGIAAGFVMVGGFLANTSLANATHMFLWTNVATSATGFLFPFSKLLPSHIVGIISLVILAIAVYAYYVAEPTAFWRKIFVSFSTAALYLNIFVLAAQTFAQESRACCARADTIRAAVRRDTRSNSHCIFDHWLRFGEAVQHTASLSRPAQLLIGLWCTSAKTHS